METTDNLGIADYEPVRASNFLVELDGFDPLAVASLALPTVSSMIYASRGSAILTFRDFVDLPDVAQLALEWLKTAEQRIMKVSQFRCEMVPLRQTFYTVAPLSVDLPTLDVENDSPALVSIHLNVTEIKFSNID